MRRFVSLLAGTCLAYLVLHAPALAQAGGTSEPKAVPQALAGALNRDADWQAYLARFVTADGRVVDTANGAISHSEGQGYGMLLAVAANDRSTFDRLWGWTRANLMVRDDALLVWRWEPNQRPAVADMNNATDGDLLVAWALTEAAEAWSETSYRASARRLAVEIGRKLIVNADNGEQILLPGLAGFSAEDTSEGPIVNPSYYVFPALARLNIVAPEFDWAGISRSGLRLIQRARFGKYNLPSEWVSMKQARLVPASGFVPAFSYNAMRVPLYLAWAGVGVPSDYAPFVELWSKRSAAGLPIIDLKTDQVSSRTSERGYEALPALVACIASHQPLPRSFWDISVRENYYPVTLQLMSQVAVQMKKPSC